MTDQKTIDVPSETAQPVTVREAVKVIESQPQPQDPMTLLTLAVQRGADVSTLERLAALRDKFLAEQAEVVFSRELSACQSEVPYIRKNAKNSHTNSTYSRRDYLNVIIKPIMGRHGFSISYGTTDCPVAGSVRVTAELRHLQGHVRNFQLDIPLDVLGAKGNPSKTQTHGYASALEYGQRYLLKMIMNIADGDDDDGNFGQGQQDSVTDLKRQLWELLKPVRGTDQNWKQARQWLIDEMCLDPDVPINDLDAAGFHAVIAAAKKKVQG